VTGSTRMKAGTATKLVLNTLTTGALIRLGKTYGNLMVDLQATNQKLVDRGERIVMEITGASRDAARAAIGAANGSVRTAIVMLRREVSRSDAEALLAAGDNHLRLILGDPPAVEPS
jgi:N-acetylmuramic acid 6-phosphate etherase